MVSIQTNLPEMTRTEKTTFTPESILFLKGSSSVIHDDYTPYSILDIFQKYRITILFAVSSIYSVLHTIIPNFQNPFYKCRYCIAGGESLPKQTIRTWKQKFGIRLHQVYCTTELLFPVLSNIGSSSFEGSVGKVVYGYKALLFNDDYAPTKVNEIGKLVVHGEGIATEYWGDQYSSSKVLRKNSYFTSDQFYRDKNGFFWFSGRDSEVFKLNGKWQSILDIEELLLQHKDIKACAVYSEVNPEGNSSIIAYLQTDCELDFEEISLILKKMFFSAQKHSLFPDKLRFVNHLPHGLTGKLDRSNFTLSVHRCPHQLYI